MTEDGRVDPKPAGDPASGEVPFAVCLPGVVHALCNSTRWLIAYHGHGMLPIGRERERCRYPLYICIYAVFSSPALRQLTIPSLAATNLLAQIFRPPPGLCMHAPIFAAQPSSANPMPCRPVYINWCAARPGILDEVPAASPIRPDGGAFSAI